MSQSNLASDQDPATQLPISMALIDPKPLTCRSIGDLLAKAFPECAMVATSTCEELFEIDERRIGRLNLVVEMSG